MKRRGRRMKKEKWGREICGREGGGKKDEEK